MRVPIAALLIILFLAAVTGTLTYPTRDDLILLLGSLSLVFISWIYTREKRSLKEEKNGAEKKR